MSLPQRQLVQLPESGKTSRSPSPIKNRYSLPILPKVDDDIRSVVSSSNELTREQLKQAARSPMAKNYMLFLIIPIIQEVQISILSQFHLH